MDMEFKSKLLTDYILKRPSFLKNWIFNKNGLTPFVFIKERQLKITFSSNKSKVRGLTQSFSGASKRKLESQWELKG